MDVNKEHRIQITEQQISDAKVEAGKSLTKRLEQKGYGAFVSRHEVLGVITDEFSELVESVQSKKPLSEVRHELLDIIDGCIFAVACIDAKALDW